MTALGLPRPGAREDVKRTIRYRLKGCEHELECALEECERHHLGSNLHLGLDHALHAVRSSLEKTALTL
jgi:hypothetical protein